MVTETYLEEICCDHLAAISAIAISIEKENCSEIDAACAIILVLHYQFLLMCIDKIVADNYLLENVREYAVRVTIIRLFVKNYFKVKKPELTNSVDYSISKTIDKWEKIYQDSLTRFLINHKKNLKTYESVKFTDEEIEKLQRLMIKSFVE